MQILIYFTLILKKLKQRALIKIRHSYKGGHEVACYCTRTPSKIRDLYKSISMPYSQPLSIERALTISNFCFSCSCGHSYEKNTVFGEVVNNEDHENILLLASPALPQHGDGTVSMPRQSPPCPLPPSHISVVRSSAGEGGETIMTLMMIREAMTMPTVSDPLRPTHNN
jgi:hypothetical protein